MKHVYLSTPSTEFQNEYLSFYREWVDSGEEMIPWVISKDPSDFQGMVQSLLDAENGDDLPDGWVPASTYWLMDEEQQVIGAVNIRHRLTDDLRNAGGHIGYGIRPSERRKGYATQLLALSLEKAKELGIERVLVVCDETNTGSEKTIRNNGGIQDTNYTEENGNVVLRFWIHV
ncbi:GNAT family N-acetyltransferase [Pullulanibacillus sp. KACC 23026]|uniref:GNAT family N-acetyltransferase n=1 Tax=Pullulanibacillus sp. KACC 23026 TaxID=3028315 RepID=UPI0023AF7B73|nr:GNAT family N-acetyltransferase [Pullulanibacillus sp. KACC 23026]WEG14479.1 GNAT family N-acetyltransferase [Pullulanibacillus sp. KACC 23026]